MTEVQLCDGCACKEYWVEKDADETVVYCSSCGKDLFTVPNQFI